MKSVTKNGWEVSRELVAIQSVYSNTLDAYQVAYSKNSTAKLDLPESDQFEKEQRLMKAD